MKTQKMVVITLQVPFIVEGNESLTNKEAKEIIQNRFVTPFREYIERHEGLRPMVMDTAVIDYTFKDVPSI